MKILIVGAGAMGSLFGGRLKARKEDVFLYNRNNPHVEKINHSGLTIVERDDQETTVTLTVVQEASKADAYDVVLVMVKAHATKSVLANLQDSFSPETLLITLQNGLGNLEILTELFPGNPAVAGTMGSGASVESDGRILHRGWAKNYIGRSKDTVAQEKLLEFIELLNRSGLETELAENVQRVIWNKLFVNVAYNSLTALTRLRNGDILNTGEGQGLLRSVVTEALQVAKAEGISMDTEEIVAKCLQMGREDIGANKSSMLMDILNKRKTEIDAINGAVAKLGKQHGIETPYNELITGIIKVIEANYDLQID
ncbi:2-dehydropantoate 2-reductase [Planococcus antarcticus DSM 14505]|uniref:2-dehydropantoate 2-reductase n=1 Tax=Planococcus antarcticus DSM 14505 TaxID=1185653 RepID=A0A1C7DK80_9BACL|nr:2-dehydropantoate 2-reductase [Planococcus antarcticus]ANU11792.1 2-dehydropantoate 2-reductase [Planococcus antarcticus DSM 14505]EIM06349.1 2-dehydropantoate 2-reductase [Planococcus antarcticus DSM 14505]